MHWEHFIFFI